jgi:hypothetical protein
MSSTWLIIAVYVLLAWFAICIHRAMGQIHAKWDMIHLINKSKMANGDYELIRNDYRHRNLFKLTLRMMFFR